MAMSVVCVASVGRYRIERKTGVKKETPGFRPATFIVSARVSESGVSPSQSRLQLHRRVLQV